MIGMVKAITERSDLLPLLAEVFREYGFEGATISTISERTGLGKGSLYHFFPGGKEEMALAVLDEIGQWFGDHIYRPLREADDPRAAIDSMCRAVTHYFQSGRRICLVGAFALDNVRDRFAVQVRNYFGAWRVALTSALQKAGCGRYLARAAADDAIIAIQGALVLARATGDENVFTRSIDRVRTNLVSSVDRKPPR